MLSHHVCPVCDVGVLWPNGWMDQDATWYGGRPRPKWHCVRWGPSSPHGKRHSTPHFLVHVYCDQTVAHLSNCWALVPVWGQCRTSLPCMINYRLDDRKSIYGLSQTCTDVLHSISCETSGERNQGGKWLLKWSILLYVRTREYSTIHTRTNRCKNSLIVYGLNRWQ